MKRISLKENPKQISVVLIKLGRTVTYTAAAAAVLLTISLNTAYARADALGGTWFGSGIVTFSQGNRERARCRVHYEPRSAETYSAVGTCATESGSVTQTAILRKVGESSYAGTFHNPEYDVSGSIHLTMRGMDSQVLRLIGDTGGYAVISLSR